MEFIALIEGLRLAKNRNLTPIEIITNSVEIIHMLHKGNLTIILYLMNTGWS